MNLTPKKRIALKEAINRGEHKYWEDENKQKIEYRKWVESNLQVDCPDLVKGSLITYISEEIIKEIESWEVDHELLLIPR